MTDPAVTGLAVTGPAVADPDAAESEMADFFRFLNAPGLPDLRKAAIESIRLSDTVGVGCLG